MSIKDGKYPNARLARSALCLAHSMDSVIYKLFLRAFPDYYKPNSIYAHYPMTIPSGETDLLSKD